MIHGISVPAPRAEKTRAPLSSATPYSTGAFVTQPVQGRHCGAEAPVISAAPTGQTRAVSRSMRGIAQRMSLVPFTVSGVWWQ